MYIYIYFAQAYHVPSVPDARRYKREAGLNSVRAMRVSARLGAQ